MTIRIQSLFCFALAVFLHHTVSADTAPGDVEIKDLAIETPLTDTAGDPVSGRKIFYNKKQGNCLACHANSDLADQQFHGEIGPSLDGVGSRWAEAQIRTILVDAKAVFTAETVMPGFYSLNVGANVRKDLVGKTILDAQQIEDLVAYLTQLK